jgi:hypothetical protein
LTFIVLILAGLLIGLTTLVRVYGITAIVPGQPGFQSVIAQIAGAVLGRASTWLARRRCAPPSRSHRIATAAD